MSSTTSSVNSRRIEVTKTDPCPHCGKSNWCYILSNGNMSACKREAEPGDGWYATERKDREGTILYATIDSKEAWKTERKKSSDKGEVISQTTYRYQLVKPSETEDFLSHLHNAATTLSEEEVFVCRKDYQKGDKEIFQGSKTSAKATAVWRVPSEWRDRILPYGLTTTFGDFSFFQAISSKSLSRRDSVVFIPEGEKCVDAIRDKGGKAICNYGGGGKGKWKESDTQFFLDLFRWYDDGERENWQEIVPIVVLCPDRDKVGLEHCIQVYKSLTLAGYPLEKIKWYFCYEDWDRIPPSNGLDIADMFEGTPDLTVQDILKNLKTTEECPWLERYFQPDKPDTELSDDDDLAFCNLWLDAVTTDIDWLVQDILPSGYSVVLSGQSGSGKSITAFDLAAAVAGGGTWMDKEAKQGKVLILNNDQSEMVLKRMLKVRLVEDMELQSQVAVKHGFVANDEGLRQLRKWMRKYDFSLVIMDSVRECICNPLGISQNDAESGYKLKKVAEIVTELGGCFVAIHHENKSKDSSGVEKASGSTSIISNVDAHWRVTKGVTGNSKLQMPKTRGYSPVEVNYQIDFNAGTCNVTTPSEPSVTSNSNSPTLGERVVTYLKTDASEDGATRIEIAEALDAKENSLKVVLQRLTSNGVIESITAEGVRQKMYRLV